ncbi:hypothetical protein OESDEN_02847 [Oesophagostomum dentatum]|uniref:Choline/carnitine acyltransferase domain-containing protein n=1 Tax=Oesophagostomum dentatum TaxID=61180 RepID=A0A0B1TIX5_OESDE|nr:hypothetical protein OESDEN_02847 [Oesophagostomum dentatum]
MFKLHHFPIFYYCRHPALKEDIQLTKEKHHNGNEHVLVMSRNQAGFEHLMAYLHCFSVEVNCISLKWAQEALFVVCLDDDDRKSIPLRTWPNVRDHERDLVARGRHLLTGGGSFKHGLNRWYDATIQLIVSSSGVNGFCIEHSVAEGIVIINMAEYALRYERENRKRIMVRGPS